MRPVSALPFLLALAACGGAADDGAAPVDARGTDASACARTLVLDFEGPAIVAGASDDATVNQSSMVRASVTAPAYRAGDANRGNLIASIVSQVQAALAPFPITVTTSRPASDPYQLIVVTRSDTDLGEPDQGELDLYAPKCPTDEISPIALGFVFERPYAGLNVGPVVVANRVVTTFGGMNGVPWSSTAGDCMCVEGGACGEAACAIGGAGTAGEGNCFTGGEGSFNEHAAFARIGCP